MRGTVLWTSTSAGPHKASCVHEPQVQRLSAHAVGVNITVDTDVSTCVGLTTCVGSGTLPVPANRTGETRLNVLKVAAAMHV